MHLTKEIVIIYAFLFAIVGGNLYLTYSDVGLTQFPTGDVIALDHQDGSILLDTTTDAAIEERPIEREEIIPEPLNRIRHTSVDGDGQVTDGLSMGVVGAVTGFSEGACTDCSGDPITSFSSSVNGEGPLPLSSPEAAESQSQVIPEEMPEETNRHVIRSGCDSIIRNGESRDKLDLVFVGAGYPNYGELEGDVRELLAGVFGEVPFSENQDAFNVWIVPSPDYPHEEDSTPSSDEYMKYVFSCERDSVVVLSKDALYRSHAFFPTVGSYGGVVFLSLQSEAPAFRSRMLAHEFGHSIAGLADEYVEEGMGDRPRAPNCASDLKSARSLWDGEYITGIEGVPGTTHIYSDNRWEDGGCGYASDNIRSTEVSIMNNHRDITVGFGPVGEAAMAGALEAYR